MHKIPLDICICTIKIAGVVVFVVVSARISVKLFGQLFVLCNAAFIRIRIYVNKMLLVSKTQISFCINDYNQNP